MCQTICNATANTEDSPPINVDANGCKRRMSKLLDEYNDSFKAHKKETGAVVYDEINVNNGNRIVIL